MRLRDLHGEATNTARRAMDENRLSRLELCYVEQCLPRGQSAHWYRSCFNKVEGPGLRRYLPLPDGDVIRPPAAESWITVNSLAYYKFCDVRAHLLDDSVNFIARDQSQVGAEFAPVSPAERYPIRRI